MREIVSGQVECVWALGAELGESPLWAPSENALYFLDIEAPAIHRLSVSGERSTWPMPGKIGALALRRGGGLIGAFPDGVFALDLDLDDPRTLLVDPEPDRSHNRLNDGRCDAAGRFWVGSMDDDEKRATGALHRIDGDRKVQLMDDGYIASNGPAFSPDGRTLYVSDTFEHLIYAFDVDANGDVANRRVFARFADADGRPDGLTVDADGGVWAAGWDAGALTRFSPNGKRETIVQLPAARVTACAFGGRDLGCLYITTARIGLSAADLAAQPLAGGLFAVDVGMRGLAPYEYGG